MSFKIRMRQHWSSGFMFLPSNIFLASGCGTLEDASFSRCITIDRGWTLAFHATFAGRVPWCVLNAHDVLLRECDRQLLEVNLEVGILIGTIKDAGST